MDWTEVRIPSARAVSSRTVFCSSDKQKVGVYVIFDGGDAGISFELRGLLSEDVMIMAKKFVELEYGLDCLTTLLSGEIEGKSNLIL